METLNSKQASFLDRGKILQGILQTLHGLSGKEYGGWKNCHSLWIPFVFKEKDGVLHGNVKEPHPRKGGFLRVFLPHIPVVIFCFSLFVFIYFWAVMWPERCIPAVFPLWLVLLFIKNKLVLVSAFALDFTLSDNITTPTLLCVCIHLVALAFLFHVKLSCYLPLDVSL